MSKVNSGQDVEARALGGAVLGLAGTGTTAPTATTVKLDDQGAPGGTGVWNGQYIVVGNVVGLIRSNTNAAAPVLTIDQWSAPPTFAVGTTPVAGKYLIVPGGAPAVWMGLTTDATAPANTDTALATEITTGGGGLKRKICPYAHSAGVASYTLTPVFTANGSDTFPAAVAKMGVFNGPVVLVANSDMLFETLVSPTATFNASGDALTLTETVTQ